MAGVEKKEVHQYRFYQCLLKRLFGKYFAPSNHACKEPDGPYYIKEGHILWGHGHYDLFWERPKVLKWEIKKTGKRWFSRSIYWIYKVGITGSNRNLDETYVPSLEILERAYKICKERECTTLVVGHKHKSCYVKYDGIRFITVGRGRTGIEL